MMVLTESDIEQMLALMSLRRSHRSGCPVPGEPEHDGCWVDEDGLLVHHRHQLDCLECGTVSTLRMVEHASQLLQHERDLAEARQQAVFNQRIVDQLRGMVGQKPDRRLWEQFSNVLQGAAGDSAAE